MIPSKETLLKYLPPYQEKWILIKDKQSVPDIIDEVLNAHKRFAPYYDDIALFFDDDTIADICDDLKEFCKDNIAYDEESEEDQTSTLPTGILIRGFGDCKHYAGFIGGVLDALNRQGRKINWKYRFASYRLLSSVPHHVFIIVNDGKNEIWIDPTPGADGKQPVWVIDKKIHSMAIRSNIAGIGNNRISDYEVIPEFYYRGQWYGNAVPKGTMQKMGIGQWEILADMLPSLLQGGSGTDGASASAMPTTGVTSNLTGGIIQSVSQLFNNIFGGSSTTAYQKIFQMFPISSTTDVNDVKSALMGAYAHYQAESWVLNPSIVSQAGDWPGAYQQLFTKYIQYYNALQTQETLALVQGNPMKITSTPKTPGAVVTPGLTTTTMTQTTLQPQTASMDFSKYLLPVGLGLLALKVFKVI